MRDDTAGQSDAADPDIPLSTIPLHSTTLLTVLDPEGTVLYESPAIERLYGYDQGELVGQQVADYFHPEDRQRVVDAFLTIREAEEGVEAVEYRHRQADGDYLWVESIAAADPTPEGNYVINTRDISAQKEYEAALEAANDRLESFARTVSHDLRNPLSVAKGHLELARAEADSDHHETVADGLNRIEALIERLLANSCSADHRVETDPVDLAAVSETSWHHVSTGEATLVTTSDRAIMADRFRLLQLLENLFRNAVEHNEGPLTVETGRCDGGFYVEDDGTGIPSEAQSAVFESGYTTAADGTGFGLEIVSQIVDAHEWDVEITDSSDGGARFEFTGVEVEQ